MGSPQLNYKVITDGDMSGDVVSSVINVSKSDTASVQLVWTGTPAGTFSIQGSLDYRGPDVTVNRTEPPNSGTWTSLDLDPVPTAAGVADSWLIDLQSLSFPYIRIVYTFVGSTGVLQAYVFSKVAVY
jgi:hypothetical protein